MLRVLLEASLTLQAIFAAVVRAEFVAELDFTDFRPSAPLARPGLPTLASVEDTASVVELPLVILQPTGDSGAEDDEAKCFRYDVRVDWGDGSKCVRFVHSCDATGGGGSSRSGGVFSTAAALGTLPVLPREQLGGTTSQLPRSLPRRSSQLTEQSIDMGTASSRWMFPRTATTCGRSACTILLSTAPWRRGPSSRFNPRRL